MNVCDMRACRHGTMVLLACLSANEQVSSAHTHISKLFILLFINFQLGQCSCCRVMSCSGPPEGMTLQVTLVPFGSLRWRGNQAPFCQKTKLCLSLAWALREDMGGWPGLAGWGPCRSDSLAGPSAICTTAPLSALSPLCLRVHHSGDPWELELIFHHH